VPTASRRENVSFPLGFLLALTVLYVDIGEYKTQFSLDGVPLVKSFVDRPDEMSQLEQGLLPQRLNRRRKTFVLHGLGGIGKTQLAVEFARRHHSRFSSVVWLDGSSEDNLRRSIARFAGRIPEGQISDTSRAYIAGGDGDLDAVVAEVMGWLAHADNTEWLLIFDNVDREYTQNQSNQGAYDVKRYFPSLDHGSILITTRLAKLEKLGESKHVKKVDRSQAREILETWYKRERGKSI
jgi:hypothetical protein